jgi:hypothetical protein
MAVVQDFLDCSKWQQIVADLESAKGERKMVIGGEEMFPALKRDRNGHGNDNCLLEASTQSKCNFHSLLIHTRLLARVVACVWLLC